MIDQLDCAVEEAYVRAGLDYRPRYTPMVRDLLDFGPSSIRGIAQRVGITHSAVSQTVSEMAKRGLVSLQPGHDARERIVGLTPKAVAMVPILNRSWKATNAAVKALEEELSSSLQGVVREAIAALLRCPFGERIRMARRPHSRLQQNDRAPAKNVLCGLRQSRPG